MLSHHLEAINLNIIKYINPKIDNLNIDLYEWNHQSTNQGDQASPLAFAIQPLLVESQDIS